MEGVRVAEPGEHRTGRRSVNGELTIDGHLQYEEVRMVVTGKDEVLMIIRNITEQKRAEAALRIAEENYRGIFENALEGIFQSTPHGVFIRINPAMARIYGYASPSEMMASITDIGQQLYVDPLGRQEFKRRMADVGASDVASAAVQRTVSPIDGRAVA